MLSRTGFLYAFTAVSVIAVVVALMAVSLQGDDDSGVTFADIVVAEGRVSCEAFLQARSYNFHTEVTIDLADREPGMDDSDGYRASGFLTTSIVDGAFEDGNYEVVISARPTSPAQGETVMVVFGDTLFFVLGGGWQSRPLNELESFPVPYLPADTCRALAPDLFLSDVASVSETVSGISAQKYHFDSLETDIPDRHPSFGPQSDAARFVNVYSGDVWVADEGGYIVKMDLSGTGQYENGRELTIEIAYDLSNINSGSIRIQPPF